MSSLSKIFFVIRHFAFRKIACPVREYFWKGKSLPFLHTGARNIRIFLHPGEYIDREIYVCGVFDKRFLEFIEDNFQHSNTMLDIGANIGNHSIFCSKFFKKIHAFEPNPIVLERLHKNISINKIENIVVHPYGVGFEDGEFPFFINKDGNLGGSHFEIKNEEELKSQAGKNDKEITVQVVNADKYISKIDIGKVDFVKIDVEGFEHEVLKGLAKTIEKDRPVLSFEFHAQDYDSGYFTRFIDILDGYEFFELVFANHDDSFFEKLKFNYTQSGKPLVKPIDKIESRTYENIIASPKEVNFFEGNAG